MKRLAILLLLLASPAWGQSVTLPKTVEAKASRPIFVSPILDGDEIHWEIDSNLDDWVKLLPPDVAKNFGNSKIFYADKGTYTIRAWTAKVVGGKAKLSDVATCVIVVDGGGPKPGPIIPTPPDVKPTPPKPIDPPAPIPAPGFRVLMVYESADLHKMPPAQLAALKSQTVRDYLDLRCVDEGGVKGWRVWDKDVDTANVSKLWRDAMARPRTSMPWVTISNGVTGYSGPLPENADKLIELLKTYGGV
jgi:hypothetical protein